MSFWKPPVSLGRELSQVFTDLSEWLEGQLSALTARLDLLPTRVTTIQITGTTSSTGVLTWTHNHGDTPTHVFIEGRSPISGTAIPAQHVTYTLTSTTCTTTFFNAAGTRVNAASVTFYAMCVS